MNMDFIKPVNWLKDAHIYDHEMEAVPYSAITNMDVIVLCFNALGVDKEGVINNFYTIYEAAKTAKIPIEVLNVPMDETEGEMMASLKRQAKWLTLKFDDPLVSMLKYMYQITCIPCIIVIKPSCEIVSTTGVNDLEVYGKNALISWIGFMEKGHEIK